MGNTPEAQEASSVNWGCRGGFWVSEFSRAELYVSGRLLAPGYGLQADSAIAGGGEGSRERCWGQALSVWLPTDGSQRPYRWGERRHGLCSSLIRAVDESNRLVCSGTSRRLSRDTNPPGWTWEHIRTRRSYPRLINASTRVNSLFINCFHANCSYANVRNSALRCLSNIF